MSIYRGPGGAGDATTDSELSALVTLTQQAQGHAAEAASSASAAASSASAASTSVASIGGSVSAASDSATAAAASASTASTKASEASTSASNAASSATAAATSATNAANSVASIDTATIVRTDTTQTISGAKTFSVAPVVPGLNGGQIGGFRNRIINGKMTVAQRGTSGGSFGTGSNYTLDRWQLEINNTPAQVGYIQQADGPPGFNSCIRLTVTSADLAVAAGDAVHLNYKMEGYDAGDLIGKTFTLSFWVKSRKTGYHSAAFRTAGGYSYVTEYFVNVANTWEYKTVTVTGGITSSGTHNYTNGHELTVSFALMGGASWQATVNTWTAGGTRTSSANQVNLMDATSTDAFNLTGVQLEVGTVATPFEHRPFSTELAMCQRYYELITTTSSGVLCTGQASSATAASASLFYKVTKRAAPGSVTSGSFQALQANGAAGGGTLSVSASNDCGLQVAISGAAGLVAGHAVQFFGASSSIAISSEL